MADPRIPRENRDAEVQLLLGDAGDVVPEPSETDFERYLAEVDRTHPERPRYRSGPFRWWHPLPGIVVIGGALALAAWKLFRQG